MRHHDLVFLKHFSQVIAILVGITIALIFLGHYINGLKPVEPNKRAIAATHERIQPAGAVYAGATGAAAQAAAAAEALASLALDVAAGPSSAEAHGDLLPGQECSARAPVALAARRGERGGTGIEG